MERAEKLRSLLSAVLIPGDHRRRLAALSQLRQELEVAETELAAQALNAGLSWSQIGAALGVSKQTAHRRHRHGAAMLDEAAETRFRGRRAIVSSEARQAVRAARSEAAAMGQGRVGTEHLLLGVLDSGEAHAVQLLKRFGVTRSNLRAAVQATGELPIEAPDVDTSDVEPAESAGGSRPSAALSRLARHTIERALGESARRPSRTLTASDLLAALLKHADGGAARTLKALGVDRRLLLEQGAGG